MWPQIDGEVCTQLLWERRWLLVGEAVLGEVGRCAQKELKPLLACLHGSEEALINRAADYRVEDVEGHIRAIFPEPVGQRTEAINAAYSLLDLGGVPHEVMVHDASAVLMEVKPFLHHLVGDENHWVERCVECLAESFSALAVAGTVLKILGWILERPGDRFTKEALVSSVSLSWRSEALSTLDRLVRAGIMAEADGIYSCLLSPEKINTIWLLLRGMGLASQLGGPEVEVVLTPPKAPNQLESTIRKLGPFSGLIQDTGEIFEHLAREARHSLVVMTPFLDEAGARFLLRLFSAVAEGGEKKLILRFLSQGKDYGKYPSGFPLIQGELAAMGVEIYDYAVKREQGDWLETFHAKAILADDRKAYIGSSNFNQFSLENSMEMGVMISGEPVRLIAQIVNSILSFSPRFCAGR